MNEWTTISANLHLSKDEIIPRLGGHPSFGFKSDDARTVGRAYHENLGRNVTRYVIDEKRIFILSNVFQKTSTLRYNRCADEPIFDFFRHF